MTSARPMVSVAIAATAMLVACAPALDWRDVRPDGWALQAALPCRPDRMERSVVVAGRAVSMGLWSCSAEGHRFGLASAALDDPAAVGPVLEALGAAAQANVRGVVEHVGPAQVPGMTPQPAARRWRLRGSLPDGSAVAEDVVVFSHGLRVYQATWVGAGDGGRSTAPFFESLKVVP